MHESKKCLVNQREVHRDTLGFNEALRVITSYSIHYTKLYENIAHKEIDLRNWRGNLKNSGFLPEERAWMDQLFGGSGFVDAFRAVTQAPDQYTWWSNRGQAWAKNVGWRIDYQVATPGVAATVQSARIYKDKRFSDHAPLIMDYDYTL